MSTYLYVFILPILLYGISYALSMAVYNESLTFNIIGGLSSIPIWFLIALPFGPMGEELGWRGFMLHRLLNNYSPIKSSVLVGLAWGVWHLTSFTFPGAAIPAFFPVTAGTIGLFCLNTVSLSFLYTYIHIKSNGSVFMAILLHSFFNAAANISITFLPQTSNTNIEILAYVGNIMLTALVGLLLLIKQTVT